MDEIGVLTLAIIVTNGVVSIQGFNSQSFMDKYLFHVDDILKGRQYRRLITAGFLHVNWTHLIFNMMSLYFFSLVLAPVLTAQQFLFIYFCSLVAGNLFALYVHRHHGDYSAAGASGAISGIIFASIVLFPTMEIRPFMLPFYIPCWLYGLLYTLYTLYGIKTQTDDIGHEAHLGGGLAGLIVMLSMFPSLIMMNSTAILLIVVPCTIFFFLLVTRPEFLLINRFFRKSARSYMTVEDRYNAERRSREREVDFILDKIGRSGYDSLTSREKKTLNNR